MEWCLDLIDPKKLLNQEVDSIDINFMRELNLNDLAVIHLSENNNHSMYSITKDHKNAYALQIKWK